MFKRLLQYRQNKKVKVPVALLFDAIRKIREGSNLIALTPATTGYNWMGVNRATHAMFPDAVLEMPQLFSNSVYNNQELKEICNFIAAQNFSKVVLSGFPPYFESLVIHLHQHGIKVYCFFHGFLSEFGQGNFSSANFKSILRLCSEGVVTRLACNKKGLPETIEKLTGIKTFYFIPHTRVNGQSAHQTINKESGKIQIGILGNDHFRKNIHNQVAAALMINNAVIHVSGNPKLNYWNCDERIVFHPNTMSHNDYINLLGQMDLNLHLSFSESWGQVTTESLAMGVPCMIANHSGIYDYDDSLRAKLVSQNFDNPYELSKEIKELLAHREELSRKCIQYVGLLNQKADILLKEFLD